jgi:inosose dehydratase
MSTRVKLSAAPIDWGVAGLVPSNPTPDELLDCVRDAGYTGCELGTHGYFGFGSREIASFFNPRGLAVSASWYDVDLSQPLSQQCENEIDLICSLLQASGATNINISDKIVPERVAVVSRVASFPETWWNDEDWAQVPRTLLEIHQVTCRRGVTVALHPHVGTHIETGEETQRMLDATTDTPIRICLDTGHLLLGGSDPIALLNQIGDRVVHVHAKDVDGDMLARLQAGEIDYFAATGRGLYSDLGTGIVDWRGLKDGLEAFGYHGWVVAEQDRLLVAGSREPFVANRRNYDFLAGLFDLSRN